MLKPAAMHRVAVVGLREERQRVVSILLDLGVVQIEPVSKSVRPLLQAEVGNTDIKDVSEQLLRMRSLKAALPPTPFGQKRGFASFSDLIAASKSVDIDDDVSRLEKDKERLQQQLDELKGRMELAGRLDFVHADLGIFDLESAASFFGLLPAQSYAELGKSLASMPEVMVYSAGADPVSAVVVVPRESLEKFGSIIQKTGLRLQRVPPMKGTSAEVLAGAQAQKLSAEAELAKTEGQLQEISAKNYSTISSLEEQLSFEARKLEVLNNFGFTENTFVLEGWVPEHRAAALEDALAKYSPSTRFFRIESDELPPTLLENPQKLRFFESFIRFYSIPVSEEFDPTLVFASFFPIFFGFMLGDVGYGISILLICLWIIRRVNHGGGKSIIPMALIAFARNIFRPQQFKKLAMAMIPGAVIGIFIGFLYNAYFGFPLNQYLFDYLNAYFNVGLPQSGYFLNPISTRGVKTLLLFAGYTGLFMVSFGLVIGMLNAYWMHERKHVVAKVGWLSVAWGISMLGLVLFHHGNVSPTSNPLAGAYIGMAVVGIALILYGEGGQALIELPSIVSHILSYTRLLGILLASVVLATVIDTVALGAMSGGIALAVVGVVILVFGQVFNLVIAIVEPGIQGARLIYVEYFSKFYHGQGRLFSPFRGARTYTMREIEMLDTAAPKAAPEIPAK